jgi:hypothetical protein
MSRLSNPGVMLRVTSAVFGAIFLPIGISFFFVLRHQHWPEGIGAVVASFGFFYVAWRADDILGLDEIRDTRGVVVPGLAAPPAVSPPVTPAAAEPLEEPRS